MATIRQAKTMQNDPEGIKKLAAEVLQGIKIARYYGGMSSIYLMRCGEFTKIGYAYDVESRRYAMMSSTPYEIELIYSHLVEKARDLEKYLHTLFINKKHRGEWFRLTEDDINEIKKICELGLL